MSEISTNAPIVNESSNNISNTKGTIAMARTSDPHSATSQFFINLKDNDFLDKSKSSDGFGYCVFAEVVEGMDVVNNIKGVKTSTAGFHADVPVEDVVITSVTVQEDA